MVFPCVLSPSPFSLSPLSSWLFSHLNLLFGCAPPHRCSFLNMIYSCSFLPLFAFLRFLYIHAPFCFVVDFFFLVCLFQQLFHFFRFFYLCCLFFDVPLCVCLIVFVLSINSTVFLLPCFFYQYRHPKGLFLLLLHESTRKWNSDNTHYQRKQQENMELYVCRRRL
jgi:hypothetical protein